MSERLMKSLMDWVVARAEGSSTQDACLVELFASAQAEAIHSEDAFKALTKANDTMQAIKALKAGR